LIQIGGRRLDDDPGARGIAVIEVGLVAGEPEVAEVGSRLEQPVLRIE
jgi:hypothetical protein